MLVFRLPDTRNQRLRIGVLDAQYKRKNRALDKLTVLLFGKP